MQLRDRVCLVTGAAQGIGAATAEALARRGARLVLGDVREDAVVRLADRLGAEAIGVALDVRETASAQATVQAGRARFGGLDVLVNNAGVGPPRTIDDLDEETWEQTLAVNLSGPYRMVRAALPELRRSRGHVANVSSLSADLWTPMLCHYNATKAGVMALSETLRIELAPHGVGVTTVYFGWVDTELLRVGQTDPRVPERLRAAMARTRRLRLLSTVSPARAGAAIVAGIERERRSVFLPRRVRLAHYFNVAIQRGVELGSR